MHDRKAAGRFLKSPVAVTSAVVLTAILLAVIIGPLLFPATHAEPGPLSYSPPTLQHPFGTDLNGRDLLYRVLAGGRISMLVGLCGAFVSLVIGTAYGLIAGYFGGKIDDVMMRIVDILYSVPQIDLHPDLHQRVQFAPPGTCVGNRMGLVDFVIPHRDPHCFARHHRVVDSGPHRSRTDARAKKPGLRHGCDRAWAVACQYPSQASVAEPSGESS